MTSNPNELVDLLAIDPPPICVTSCEYALDVGMPEYSGKKPGKACGNCAHYDPIEVNFGEEHYFTHLNMDLAPCGAICPFGTCNHGNPYNRCGGCCGELGCMMDQERKDSAPFVWEGDYA